MAFLSETLDAIKDRADLLDLATRAGIEVVQRGSTYKARCPFHAEKSASFYLYPNKGTWKCYGCGAGGDAINLYARTREITFPQAVRELAVEYQVEVKEDDWRNKREKA